MMRLVFGHALTREIPRDAVATDADALLGVICEEEILPAYGMVGALAAPDDYARAGHRKLRWQAFSIRLSLHRSAVAGTGLPDRPCGAA